MNTLKELSNSMDCEIFSTEKNLIVMISSFKLITYLILMRNIFMYTTLLSMYLQSASIDFINALSTVDICAKNLSELRNDNFEKTLND